MVTYVIGQRRTSQSSLIPIPGFSTLTIPNDFAGLHFFHYPNKWGGDASALDSEPSTVIYRNVRSHDFKPHFWAITETSAGVYDFETYWKPWMDYHVGRGATVCKTIYGTPSFYASGVTPDAYGFAGGNTPPTDLTKVANFVTAFLNRFNGDGTRRITEVEPWNEPAAPNAYWTGTWVQMVALCNAVYNAVKAFDPAIKVWSPGFSGGYSPLSVSSAQSFLTTTDPGSGKTGAQVCDGIAFHHYGYEVYGRAGIVDSPDFGLTRAKVVAAANGAGGYAHAITESGLCQTPGDAMDVAIRSLSADGRRRFMFRLMARAALDGCKRFCMYGWNSAWNCNFHNDPGGLQQGYNDFDKYLAGQTVTAAGWHSDGSIEFTTAAGTFVI